MCSSGRSSWRPAMAVSTVAAGVQTERSEATRGRPQSLPAEQERAGRGQEHLGEQELRNPTGGYNPCSFG